jgi:hypothetical protein
LGFGIADLGFERKVLIPLKPKIADTTPGLKTPTFGLAEVGAVVLSINLD